MEITIGQKGPIGLNPGQKMSISYPLVAPDPSPANDVVAAPARIDFSAGDTDHCHSLTTCITCGSCYTSQGELRLGQGSFPRRREPGVMKR